MHLGTLYKQGGSIVLALPKAYLETLRWSPGKRVAIYLVSEQGLLLKDQPEPIELTPKLNTSPMEKFRR